MNEVTIFFGASEEEKDHAMLAYAAGRQPATWYEANTWRLIGLIDGNPYNDPNNRGAHEFDWNNERMPKKSTQPAKPSIWRRLIFAE